MTKNRFFLLVAAAFFLAVTASAQSVNYDEAAVAPYTLQDPLVFANGKKVKKSQWQERRTEILD
ncbi:MAG: acetylxylan esterase, partial [Bacteroidales bacterium]|nr:acetylxylan esterase [Bacteroidales bacterium]